MTNLFQKFIKNGVEINMPVIPEVNTKTFQLSGASDLTTAQAILDYYNEGNNPVIYYADNIYTISYVWTDHIDFIENEVECGTVSGTASASQGKITINFDNGEVTTVVIGSEPIISLTAGTNIQIAQDGTISATDTTYTAGTGISIDANNVISNAQTNNVIAITQAEYNALSTAEKNDGKLRIITDAPTEDISVDWTNVVNKPSVQTTNNLKTSLTDDSDTYYPSQKAVKTAVDAKQDTLVSGTNIKTINGTSILGNGDITTPGATYTAGTGLSLSGTEFSNAGVTSVNGSTGAITNVMKGTDSTSASYTISVVSELPSNPDSSVIYIVTS